MNRMFGRKKDESRPTLSAAIQNVEGRSESFDKKIIAFNSELNKLREQMAKLREGPSKEMLKQRALRILKQRMMYEEQRDKLHQQMFNMDQTNYTIMGMKDNQTTYVAMKDGLKVMKTEYKKLKIEKVEKLQDAMADMIEKNNDINEALSLPTDFNLIDESELNAELELLGEELDAQLLTSDLLDIGYMDAANTAPIAPSGTLATDSPNQPAKTGVDLDEFGLPKVPAREIR